MPTVIKHVLNQRNFAVVDRKYQKSLKAHGFVGTARGDIIVIWSKDRSFPVRAVTGGQLTGAFYNALTAEPENRLLQISLQQGLKNVITLSETMPDSVIRWLRDYYNQFHGGCGVSFLELIEESAHANASWDSFKNVRGITANTGWEGKSYHDAMMEFMQKHHGNEFPEKETFMAARAVYNYLSKDTGLYDKFKKWSEDNLDFTAADIASLSAEKSVKMIAQLTGFLNCKRLVKVDKQWTQILLMGLVQQLFPTVNAADEASGPPLLKVSGRKREQLLSALLTDMKNSVVYTNALTPEQRMEAENAAAKTKKENSSGKKTRKKKNW